MNKKIKGYELMKLIAENKIKEGQEFVLTIKNTLTKKRIYWSGKNLIYCDTGKFVFADNADIYFLLGDVEILEDEEEIEEIKVDDNNYIVTDNGTNLKGRAIEITFVNKINEIIKKVNKLDKKINKED